MFGKKKRVKEVTSRKVNVTVCRSVLKSVFDECDRHDHEETGGRILGFYVWKNNVLEIRICGEIGPGPKARRSRTSFFPDGEFQEKIFRKIEAEHSAIEHLGNWHTHHVNGLDTLSEGDKGTYTRTVNHKKHNIDFFYALLVVAKNNSSDTDNRYALKHFIIFRGDPVFCEIPSSHVTIVDDQAVWVGENNSIGSDIRPAFEASTARHAQTKQIRAIDSTVIPEMYPEFKPFLSKGASGIYWKGKLSLINGVSLLVAVIEVQDGENVSYVVGLSEADRNIYKSSMPYLNRTFSSAVKAIWSLEQDLNRECFIKKLMPKE